MNLDDAIYNLNKFQEWRRYDGPVEKSPPMPHPTVIGEAIDIAINILENLKNDK